MNPPQRLLSTACFTVAQKLPRAALPPTGGGLGAVTSKAVLASLRHGPLPSLAIPKREAPHGLRILGTVPARAEVP